MRAAISPWTSAWLPSPPGPKLIWVVYTPTRPHRLCISTSICIRIHTCICINMCMLIYIRCVVNWWEGIGEQEMSAHCVLYSTWLFWFYFLLFDQWVFRFRFVSFHMSAWVRFILESVKASALICDVVSRYQPPWETNEDLIIPFFFSTIEFRTLFAMFNSLCRKCE